MAGRATALRGIIAPIVVLSIAVVIPQYFNSTTTRVFAEVLAFAVAAVGLNLLTGYNGQISIGHAAFFGTGAYTTAILMDSYDWRWLWTLPVVIGLLAVVGAIAGFPALRVKGLYLALMTLGLAALFPDLAARFVKGTGGTPLVQPDAIRDAIGGPSGVVSTPSWAEWMVDMDDQWRYYMALTTAVIMCILAANLVRGRFGRALVAVRDHETAAGVLGVNPARVKIAAFSISAVYAGIGGAVSVLVRGSANAGKVEVFQDSILLLVAVVVGGTATTWGPIIGAIAVVLLREWLPDWIDATPGLGSWVDGRVIITPAIFGIALIILMYVAPDGVMGALRRLSARTRTSSSPA